MFGAERRQAILDLVRIHGSVSIARLARAVNVSEVTVRSDVATLEKRGMIVRGHGGAMLTEDERMDSVALGDAASVPRRTAMFGAERRQLICTLVQANKAAGLGDLARTLNVSEMTVRRDLDILEKRGLLRRTHGGAVVDPEPATAAASVVAAPRERVIAAIAALAEELAEVDGPLMLGAGATVYALARRLRPVRPTTVLTNSMLVARALSATPHVHLVVASGVLDGASLALVGSSAERWVARHRVARSFVSGTGLTPSRGLSSASLELGGVDRAMVASAEEVVVLADHTKLGVETTYQVAAVSDIDHLVTDRGGSELLASFSARGVRVHLPANPVPHFA